MSQDLPQKLLAGDRRSLARAITLVENRDPQLRPIMDVLYPRTGQAFLLGITGPPGAGKSTVTDRLVAAIRATGQTAAVVAIDPSSPFSGGAILGDRIRMQDHNGDPGVYIRSLGTRGKHGGLSHAARDVVMVLDAAGFNWIIVETAGVGQTELDILKLAHGVAVVLVPESGDGIQMMKAGLLEIADIFVVNKCDRPESDKIVRELINMVGMGASLKEGSNREGDQVWTAPVLKTQAILAQGISDLLTEVSRYKDFAEKTGRLNRKRLDFLRDEVIEIISDNITQVMAQKLTEKQGEALMEEVFQKRVTPYEAAERLQTGKT